MTVPDVVTHYYLADRRPFLNLSDLDDQALGQVLAELDSLRRSGSQHRPFGPKYMTLRRLTEARLRALFIEAGGKPERVAPHYFVLGDSPWYQQLATRMHQVQLPLSALPSDKTSITYPDSFGAMKLGTEFGLAQQRKPYHGRLFLLEELPALTEQFGIPSPAWNDEHEKSWTSWPDETYVEVQLWSDEPVRSYLV